MTASLNLTDYLRTRRSVTLPFLREPGPSGEELDEMLRIAARVPDHGKLAPWRLILYRGDARQKAGRQTAEIFARQHPEATPEQIAAEESRFLPAPLTIGVVSTARPHPKIPQFEQLLSAGCVAFNLLHAAAAFGYGAQWVTRWFAYDAEAAAILGAGEDERFVAFVHIGTPEARLEDRPRPDPSEIVTEWQG